MPWGFKKRFYHFPQPLRARQEVLLYMALLAFMLLGIRSIPKSVTHRIEHPHKIKVTMIEKPSSQTPEDQKRRQIVETPLRETLPPKESDYFGKTNHQTPKQTKVKNPVQNAEDAGNPEIKKLSQQLNKSEQTKSPDTPTSTSPWQLKESDGPTRKVSQKILDQLMPRLQDLRDRDLAGTPGFQDHIRDDLEASDVIDVNTSEFRWLGYFTIVRKNVSQTFFSPYAQFSRSKDIQDRLKAYGEAKLKGLATVELEITRSGVLVSSKLVHSSGDKIVDDFWLEVLNLAAPYPPLPKHYEEESLKFTYSLDYDFVFRTRTRLSPSGLLDDRTF